MALLTAGGVMVQGDVLYGLFCLVALALTLLPAILARSVHQRTPLELELGLLLIMIGDMTLGNLLGLYVTLPWYDKVLHLGSSILVGWIGFLAIYALHATGRLLFRPWHDGVAILLVTLGVGALWEIAEYSVDQLFGRATQGAPGMAPLDDTMIDLILDGIGGMIAAVLGPLYLRYSAHSRQHIAELVELIAHPLAPGPPGASPPGGAWRSSAGPG